MEILFEMGGTFVYLWKITSQQFPNRYSAGSCSILSNKIYTRNPSLHLQLELICHQIEFRASRQYYYKVRVRCCHTRYDKQLQESKYLMSAFVHDNHGYSSRVQILSDFSSSHSRRWETLCRVDLMFPVTYKNLVVKNGLLVVFELELKS